MLRHQRPWGISLSKNSKFFLSFRNTINLCAFRQKHTLTPYWFLQWGQGKTFFVFIFMIANFMLIWNHSKSCTPSCDWGQLTNCYCKTKVKAYNDKLPWGCRRSQSWKGSATKIPCQADPGLRQVLPVGIELSSLRPGLVYQSQECSTHI